MRFYYEGRIDELKDYPIGMNLVMVCDKDTQKLVRSLHKIDKSCRWMGFWLAGGWFYNITESGSFLNNYFAWLVYEYNDLEEKLLSGNYDILEDEYDIPHILYVLANPIKNGNWFTGEQLLIKYLKKASLETAKDIEDILRKFERWLKYYDKNSDKMIIKYMAIESGNALSSGSSDLIDKYNNYVVESAVDNIDEEELYGAIEYFPYTSEDEPAWD